MAKAKVEVPSTIKDVAGIIAIVVLTLGAYVFGEGFGTSCIEQTVVATSTESVTYSVTPVECPVDVQ